MTKALVFGASGQDGYYLSALLQARHIEVLGASRSGGQVRGDVGEHSFVDETIRSYRPDLIFHLAAKSSTRHEALFDNHSAVSTGTLNILESVRLHAPRAKVFLSGSAMQFENKGIPIDEQTPFEASSSYAVARIQSVYAARYFRSTFGIRVYVGYFFNHDSPLRSERHVNQKIVAAVLRIASGSPEKLKLGNIEVRKEFNYAGDIVDAVWSLINQDEVFEAVIGCGSAHSIRQWVEYCFGKVGRNWRESVEVDRSFVPEYRVLVSNPSLIKGMGWSPKVNFQGLADMMMGAS